MRRLGLGPRNPVYFDMEHYDGNSACSTIVMLFLTAWRVNCT